MRVRHFRQRLPQGFLRVQRPGFVSGIFSGRVVHIFQRPAFTQVEFAAVAPAKVDGEAAGNRVDPTGKFRAVTQQPQLPICADERFLRDVLRERGVTKPAPRNGIDAAFVAFDEFAVTLGITAAHGGHGGFVLLCAGIGVVGHFDWFHLTARQPQREIVTCHIFTGICRLARSGTNV